MCVLDPGKLLGAYFWFLTEDYLSWIGIIHTMRFADKNFLARFLDDPGPFNTMFRLELCSTDAFEWFPRCLRYRKSRVIVSGVGHHGHGSWESNPRVLMFSVGHALFHIRDGNRYDDLRRPRVTRFRTGVVGQLAFPLSPQFGIFKPPCVSSVVGDERRVHWSWTSAARSHLKKNIMPSRVARFERC